MGCNVSRFEMKGATLAARLRLRLVKRLEARSLTRRPHKQSTPSKKELLSHHDQEDMMNPSNLYNPSNGMPYSLEDIMINNPELPAGLIEPSELKILGTPIKSVGISIIIGNNYAMKVVAEENLRVNGKSDTKESPIADARAKKEDVFGDDEDEEDDDDDDEDDERMIGYGDGQAFPGSPSFRIYYKENWEDSHNEIGKNDALKEPVISTGDIIPPKDQSCVEKKVKRGRKKRCFNKVLPKRGQVKNILNVKSLYASSHDRRHIITGKPPIS